MFSGVASLLFGSSSTEPETEVKEVDVPTRDAELGWVVVDLPSSEKSSNEGENRQQQQQQGGECPPPPHHCELRVPVEIPEGDSSCPSDPESTSSQNPCSPGCCSPSSHSSDVVLCNRNSIRVESWVLTPPPCFTGRRKRNTGVADSPMENLLIEHPSMSVYNSYGGDSTGELSNQSESSSDVDMEDESVAHRTRNQMVHQAPRRPHAIAARAGMLAHVQNVKFAQRKQRLQNCKHMSKKNIERSNKVKEYQSLGKRQSQRNRTLRPSGCMNGRIGQRKF
ncbi:tumor protein p53-inducible nuclear protein 2-like isoform X1 [Haliotis cracherodii]|uniref:tumor protein p53-inducible nuclear protein 2-like isoform X1 n=1 Tax=Haliotis rufescens TaxID=6454 RepID=UPI001EB02D1B|nr:tumor protein p53-inducible nuclear protein 2-like isoform X1 [Haliotis rufescens]